VGLAGAAGHVVLLGDSIFDNAAYVHGPDVIAQLRSALPADWNATLLAVDGAVVTDVPRQLARLPADATDIVLSVGGNDALGHIGLLDRRARDGAEALRWFADAAESFAARYRELLERIARSTTPSQSMTVCTIYNGNLEPSLARAAIAALAVFNDAITRAARRHGYGVIELRDLFTEPADYANPIEPSIRGGAKLAGAIAALVAGVEETARS
jgi:hypothetical protein